MFGLIKQLSRGLLVFGLPALVTFCMWVLLDPATFWQTLTTVIIGTVVYVVLFVTVCLALNEMI